MRLLVAVVKRWLVPGTLSFLFLGVVAAAVLLNVGAYAAARIWLSALAAGYYLLSLPAVARGLIKRLARDYGPLTKDECRSARSGIVVVVGNGAVHYSDGVHRVDYLTRRSVHTAFEAARICRLMEPDRVVVTGGLRSHPQAAPESELIRQLLAACGVDPQLMTVESDSHTTAEQAANVARLLARSRWHGSIVVVTTPAHMPRVMHEFAAAGLTVVPSATPELSYDDGVTGWRRWSPSMSALIGSASAIYEFMAGALASLSSRPPQNSV